MIVSSPTAFSYQANSTIELGLIGAGSRGSWITDHFVEQTGARFTAVADAYPEKLAAYGDKWKIDAQRRFVGVESYRELLRTNVDAVVIETPTLFHPEQAEAAVAAGKHVFCAKPVATDVPGAKQFQAAGEAAARNGLTFWVDFQTRARPVFQEAVARVRRGEIGEPVFGHIYYHAGANVWHDTAGRAAADQELINWLHSRRISGDILVEQNIHVVDVANWYLNAHPVKAIGFGGQSARKRGDVFDHYVITFFYESGAKVDFSSVQFAKGYADLCMRLYGSQGTVDAHYNSFVRITGENKWTGTEKDDTFKGGAIQNAKDFIQSIRENKPINNAVESVRSNLTCILGRQAATRERMVTWAEMMATTVRYDGRNQT
jgi:predicted dehydrogenase